MRIIDIRETAIALETNMRNAVFDFSEMTTSVVAVITDVVRDGAPVVGYAFNSTGRYACGAAMRERFIPRVLRADPAALIDPVRETIDPERVLACMQQREKPGGHAERSIAIGTIETAVWDALAKIEGKPLHRVLADRYSVGVAPSRVFCYVGGGWYRPGGTIGDLQDEIRRHLDAGYTLVKIKVGGAPLAEDLQRIEAAIGVLGSGARLAVDANAKFDRDEALRYATALAPYGLRWFEEPCDPDDFELHAELAAAYAPPLGAGENLYGVQAVRNLVRLGGFRRDHDIIQVDPPQSYGLASYARTMRMLEAEGWGRKSLFPHGGNQMSLALVAGLGLGGCEAYPGVFGVFGGYADDARMDDGFLALSDRPGIGFEGHAKLHRVMRELAGV